MNDATALVVAAAAIAVVVLSRRDPGPSPVGGEYYSYVTADGATVSWGSVTKEDPIPLYGPIVTDDEAAASGVRAIGQVARAGIAAA